MANGPARVILGAPEGLSILELNAIKEALSALGAIVIAHRTQEGFCPHSFSDDCEQCSHFVLVADGSAHEPMMISAALGARIPRITIICLKSIDDLRRHEARLNGALSLVVTRTYRDKAKVGHVVSHTLVAENLVRSALEIAQAVLNGSRW